MTIYRVCVRAGKDGFETSVEDYECEFRDGFVYLTNFFNLKPIHTSAIDRMLEGLLYAYDPQLEVYTLDKDRIDPHIERMKERIRTYLLQRLEYIDYLIDICK